MEKIRGKRTIINVLKENQMFLIKRNRMSQKGIELFFSAQKATEDYFNYIEKL